MEAVAAVGLAAAILQFVELSVKVTERLADFSAAASGIPRAFRQVATELPLIVDALSRLRVQADAGRLSAATEKALLPVVEGCQDEARRLAEVLERTLPAKDGSASSWERRRKALMSLASDKKVEKAAEALGRYMTTLSFHQSVDTAGMMMNLHITDKAPEAPPAYKAGHWLVPFDRNPSFVGRDSIFQEIDATLDVTEGSQPRAALFGLGGIGKSQIALEYCYRYRQQHPDRAIFWVNAATHLRFEESFQRIATACDLVSRDNPDEDAAAVVQNWLATRYDGRWLMVVDNVDDITTFFSETMRTGKTPAEYLPRHDSGALLFTTRSSDAAVDLATPSLPISIDQMSKDEGLQLFKARLSGGSKGKTKSHASDEDSIVELLGELEYIPLAITQAVAFIAKRRRTVQQYLTQYRSSNTAARGRLLGYEFADHGRQGGSLDSVAKTWAISFDAIRDTNPRAADMLCMLSYFQHQAIPEALLHEVRSTEEGLETLHGADDEETDEEEDRFDFEDAIALLCAYSFLSADESQELAPIYSTHRLVQLATRWWITKQGPEAEDRYALAALRSITSKFPTSKEVDHPLYLSRCEALLPHAEPLLAHKFRNSTPLASIASTTPAVPNLNPFASYTRTSSPTAPTDLPMARLLAHTGRYINFLGSTDLARTRFHASYHLRSLHLPPSHHLCLTSSGLLFWMLAVLEHDPTSESFGRGLLTLRRASLGNDHPDTIDGLSDLASLIGSIPGREAESEAMQREALGLAQRVLGPTHPDTINCTAHLASILSDMGHHAEAATHQRRVVRLRLEALGPEHPVVLTEECNLAGVLSKRRETFVEALGLSRRNLEVKKRVLGVDHSETLVSALNYGVYLRASGQVDEARRVYGEIVREAEQGARRENAHSRQYVDAMRASMMDMSGVNV